MGNKPNYNHLAPVDYILLGVFISYLGIYFYFFHPGFQYSDEYWYIKYAYELTESGFQFNNSIISHRIFMHFLLFPFVTLFGITTYAASFAVFCFFILSTILSSYILGKIDVITARLYLVLSFLTFIITRQILTIGVDLTLYSLLSLSFSLLFYVRVKNKNSIIYGLLFSFLIICSFLTKLSIIFPGLAFFMFFLKDAVIDKSNQKFWWSAALTFILFIIGYFSYYHFLEGNLLMRITTLENEYNISQFSYYNSSWLDILQRITIQPINFMIHDIQLIILFTLFTVYSLFHYENAGIYRFWILSGWLVLLIHWWGTTSLQTYNPIPLDNRMWLSVIPPLLVISSVTIKKYLLSQNAAHCYNNFYLAIIITFISIGIYRFFTTSYLSSIVMISISLPFLYSYLNNRSLINFLPSHKHTLLSICFILIYATVSSQFLLKLNNRTTDFRTADYEKKLLKEVENKSKSVVIYSDSRIAKYGDFYYNFNLPDHLTFINWTNHKKIQHMNSSVTYILYNKKRIKFDINTYGVTVPEYINDNIPDSFLNDNGSQIYFEKVPR